ncbi:MAG: hypothetical protein AAFY76_22455 [Cyanobacteria bacterium J06649_11]
MSIYNQNDEFVEIDENFINGYLTPIALLRDYTTYEVGFNYYFKRLENHTSIKSSISEEFRASFKRFCNHKGRRYKSDEEVERLIETGLEIDEIKDWETSIVNDIDSWTGTVVTNNIKEENLMNAWNDKPNLLSLDLIEILKVFFRSKEMKAFKYKGEILNDLNYHWGGLHWLDILFSNHEENYLLHFDLSD